MKTSRRALFLAATTGSLCIALTACAGSPAPNASPVAGRPLKLLDRVSFPHTELDADGHGGDGTHMLIKETDLPVAVYDPAGTLLGSAPLRPGRNFGTTVTLAAPPAPGIHSLLAVLTVDDGDGKYDPARDAPGWNDGNGRELEDEGLRYAVR
ncbi:hypothetical protein [Amycolatopsis samaneae]|uniref:Uncharacterized protein n=1 Tax=Amycolatopsis samaneae TaxID=664691 RepID=A0ABW5GX15_9PSEU